MTLTLSRDCIPAKNKHTENKQKTTQYPGPLNAHGGHFSDPLSFLQSPTYRKLGVCVFMCVTDSSLLSKPQQLPELAGYKAQGGLERDPLSANRPHGGGGGAGPSTGTAQARGAANQRAGRAGRRRQSGAGCHRRPTRAAGGNLEVPPPPLQEQPGSGGPFQPPTALSRRRARPRPRENPEEKAAAQGPVSSPTSLLPLRYFFSSRKVVPGGCEQAPGGAEEEGFG